MALILKNHARDFISGSEMDFSTYSNEKIDIHHIFPKDYCLGQKYDKSKWNSIVNKTPISASSNREIGGVAPSVYLERLEKKGSVLPSDLDGYVETHWIDHTLLRSDQFRISSLTGQKSCFVRSKQLPAERSPARIPMKCSGLLGRRWNKYLLIENLVLPGRAKARACAPAVSKTRTVFVAAPNRARTRLIPGVHPRTAPVFPGGEKARGCAGQFAHAPSRRRAVCNGRLVTRVAACNASAACKAVRPVCFFPARLRRASRAPCLWLRPVSHARGWFRVQAHAELLFSRQGKGLASVSCGWEKARKHAI